jgi:L-fucose mutarotase
MSIAGAVARESEKIMLKGIPEILSPELLKILMELGHGDELLIADGNFPTFAHPSRVVRADGHGILPLLDAILTLIPLDAFVEHPAFLMQVSPGDSYVPEIQEVYRQIGYKHEEKGLREEYLERFAFYERAKNAQAVIATGERALYANIILRKGVVI